MKTSAGTEGGSARTALIVDDDEGFVRQLSRFVERICGVTVLETAHGAEDALEKLRAHQPTFILLDICMSRTGMSGLEAIEPLKTASPASSIIVVSSMAPEYGTRAKKLGATGFVEKTRLADELPRLLTLPLEHLQERIPGRQSPHLRRST